ncbi:retrotransposon protein, putative, ty1-copia subclass, partial [Tanacetum coccineum]
FPTLAEENMRGTCFKVCDAVLDANAIHRCGSQLISTTRQTPIPGTPLFNIKAYLPVVESTEFSHVLRNCTSEQAFPHLALDHWDMMPSDPLEEGSFDTSPVLEPEPTVKVRGTRFKTRPNCYAPLISTSSNSKVPFWDYALDSAARIHKQVPNKKVEKTTIKILHVDAEEHELGDLGELANYKAALLDHESDKWLDDMNVEIYKDVKSYLEDYLAMKQLEKLHIILGKFQAWNYPNAKKLKLSKSQGAATPAEKQRMQNAPYASTVGSIMYAVRCTRPDVTFAQNITSRFQQNPGELHWTTVKNILKYLRNTKDMILVYRGDTKRELRVSCYTDAGYLTDADDLKSQTGYVFILNGDDEYIAAFDASKEAVWIRKFISGLGIVPTIEEPINMYCDNTGAIVIAKDPGITKGARIFRSKVHYL